jgi:hypothetical protein
MPEYVKKEERKIVKGRLTLSVTVKGNPSLGPATSKVMSAVWSTKLMF